MKSAKIPGKAAGKPAGAKKAPKGNPFAKKTGKMPAGKC